MADMCSAASLPAPLQNNEAVASSFLPSHCEPNEALICYVHHESGTKFGALSFQITAPHGPAHFAPDTKVFSF